MDESVIAGAASIDAGDACVIRKIGQPLIFSASGEESKLFRLEHSTAREADASGDSWLPAIQVAKTLIEKQLPITPDADLSEIKTHMSVATSDFRLPDQTRRALMDLLRNVNEMERMFEKPTQRSIQSQIDKIIDLTDRYHALVRKQQLELGAEE